MILVSYYSGSNLLLASVGAKEADPNQYPELVNIVQEMKISWSLVADKKYAAGGKFQMGFELLYFSLQVHLSDGWLQPTHTPFLISLPQVLHSSHPQV